MINFGLNVEAQELDQKKDDKHLMGGFGTVEYPDLIKAHPYWTPYWNKIAPETQFGANVETMGCTGYGTGNILEMEFKQQFNLDMNISDRFVNKASGTTAEGNTVDAPIDTIRKYGFLLEEEYPWDRQTCTFNEYYQALTEAQYVKAATRLNDWDFAHEYVPVNPEAMMAALKTSPLGGTVAAWHKGDDGLYRTMGYGINHYTVAILDYKEGEYWLCGDTYPEDYNCGDNPQQPEFLKKLAWDYNFGCVKRYKIIDKRLNKIKKIDWNNMFSKMQAYMDAKGLNVFWIDKAGKQKIELSTMGEKALFMSAFADGDIRKTTWPAIAALDDKKYF